LLAVAATTAGQGGNAEYSDDGKNTSHVSLLAKGHLKNPGDRGSRGGLRRREIYGARNKPEVAFPDAETMGLIESAVVTSCFLILLSHISTEMALPSR
jgi:hypothetical protein